MLKCGKCAAAVTETAIFCSMCGIKLTEAQLSPSENKADPPASPIGKATNALAKASGLTKTGALSRNSFLIRTFSVVAGVLLLASAYLFYRTSNSSGTTAPPLNFVAPLDQYNQLVAAGNEHYQQGDFNAAVLQFEQAEKLNPNHTGAILRLAHAYANAGQVENALAKFSRVLELDAKNIEARYQRAELLLDRGVWKDAYDDFQYIVTNAPNSEQSHYARKILANFTAQRTTEVADEKSATPGRRTKRGVQLPEALDTSRFAMALPELATPTPSAPPLAPPAEDPAGATALARIHKQKGQRFLNARQYYAAISELQSARKFSPDDPDICYYLGSAHDGLKQYSQARKYYELCDSGVYAAVARSAAKNARKNEQDDLKRQSKKNKEKTDDE